MPKDLSPQFISQKLTFGNANEKINIDSSAFSPSLDVLCDPGVGTVYWKTTIASYNFDISPVLTYGQPSDIFPIGEIKTITAIVQLGSTPYNFGSFRINGASQSIKWAGGSAPTLATNAFNVFTFSVIRTATDTYTVFGTWVKYA